MKSFGLLVYVKPCKLMITYKDLPSSVTPIVIVSIMVKKEVTLQFEQANIFYSYAADYSFLVQR